jgi:heterotetrameric sarcosine oxidase gamma subunit
MTTQGSGVAAASRAVVAVVRRSALEARHELLGATFASETERWPRQYGDPAAERAAVAAGAGLAELGPYGEVLLRGPGVADLTARLTAGAVPDRPAVVRATLGGSAGAAWCLGPDEVLLIGPAGSWSEELATHLGGADASAIEMTGARTALRLAGPAAPAIMAELCPADTTPSTLEEGQLLQAPLAGPRAFIVRHDGPGRPPGYTFLVARDEAAYVWDATLAIGSGHGLVPVGPAAVGSAAAEQEEGR